MGFARAARSCWRGSLLSEKRGRRARKLGLAEARDILIHLAKNDFIRMGNTVAGGGQGGAACVATGTLQAGVPLNLAQRWLGHARISTTAIYSKASGPDELEFAQRFWCFDR
jgi:hypothetical protein